MKECSCLFFTAISIFFSQNLSNENKTHIVAKVNHETRNFVLKTEGANIARCRIPTALAKKQFEHINVQ